MQSWLIYLPLLKKRFFLERNKSEKATPFASFLNWAICFTHFFCAGSCLNWEWTQPLSTEADKSMRYRQVPTAPTRLELLQTAQNKGKNSQRKIVTCWLDLQEVDISNYESVPHKRGQLWRCSATWWGQSVLYGLYFFLKSGWEDEARRIGWVDGDQPPTSPSDTVRGSTGTSK